MTTRLENLEITGNEWVERDAAVDVHFGLETNRIFLLMSSNEKVAGTLFISLIGQFTAEFIHDPVDALLNCTYYRFSGTHEEHLSPQKIKPRGNMGHKYRIAKKLTARNSGYIDVVTQDDYYIKPCTTVYDQQQRRAIEDLKLRSIQIGVNA